MNGFSIRRAMAGEEADVAVCVNAAYDKYVERMGQMPAPMLADYRSLIAEGVVQVLLNVERVCGVLVLYPEDTYLFLENIAVHPDYQGRGLGRMLMALAEERARDLELDEIRLYTNEAMTENLAFYLRLGFVETERRADAGYRRVFMRKTLDI